MTAVILKEANTLCPSKRNINNNIYRNPVIELAIVQSYRPRRIEKSTLIAYGDLGPQAIYRLEVEDFPVTVINDIYGGDLYEEGKARYKVPLDSD